MAIQAQDIATLHTYAQGVLSRAQCHAVNISAITLALMGAVIWNCRPGSVEIKQYNGNLANLIWWESELTDARYVLAYNHHLQFIELRDRGQNGTVLYSFDNTTPITHIEQIFTTL
jgi:hypothetical protein